MEITVLQYLLLGIVQGVLEWLPISSSAFIVLIMSNLYGVTDLSFLLHSALFLHLGTFFSAIVYFWKDVKELLKTIFKYKKTPDSELVLFNFILVSSIVTAFIGIIMLILMALVESSGINATGKAISFTVGFLLLITGIVQIKTPKKKSIRTEKNIKLKDSFIVGSVQGFSTLPGLSRSGITVSTLLLRKFDDTTALKLSFLMGLPVILFGNLILNYGDIVNVFSGTAIYGLFTSFVFGLLTISILMKLSRKINFGWFVLIFALLMMISIIF
jgi:undecaprenyl-diphosphatase